MVYCSEDVHQHPVIRSLVELSPLSFVVFIEHLSNELKNLGHELMFIELEHFQEDHNQLHKAVNIPEVESVRWSPLSTFVTVVKRLFNACLDHHFAEAKKQLLIRVDSHSSEVFEKSIYLLLLILFVINIGHHNPFDEEFSELGVIFVFN